MKRHPVHKLGFWCGGGFAAGVGGAQRDGSGCHEAEGAAEQGPLESGGECRRGGVWAASRWLVRLVERDLEAYETKMRLLREVRTYVRSKRAGADGGVTSCGVRDVGQ